MKQRINLKKYNLCKHIFLSIVYLLAINCHELIASSYGRIFDEQRSSEVQSDVLQRRLDHLRLELSRIQSNLERSIINLNDANTQVRNRGGRSFTGERSHSFQRVYLLVAPNSRPSLPIYAPGNNETARNHFVLRAKEYEEEIASLTAQCEEIRRAIATIQEEIDAKNRVQAAAPSAPTTNANSNPEVTIVTSQYIQDRMQAQREAIIAELEKLQQKLADAEENFNRLSIQYIDIQNKYLPSIAHLAPGSKTPWPTSAASATNTTVNPELEERKLRIYGDMQSMKEKIEKIQAAISERREFLARSE